MLDRDVINHLQIIRTWAAVDGKSGRGIDPVCCRDIVGWVDDAITLLKKQEPVKPIIQRGWYRCGNCRNGIASMLDTGKPSHKQSYCEMCGRAVKWDGLPPEEDDDAER